MAERHDPTAPPDRAFWLDALQVPGFERVVGFVSEPDELAEAFGEKWTGRIDREVAAKLIDDLGDSPGLRANLVLLAEFIEKKKNAVIRDVARGALGERPLMTHPAFRGRGHRLAAAALVYAADPSGLRAIDLWDRWHPRRRCAMKLSGQRRKPTFDLAGLDWPTLTDGALDALGRSAGGLRYQHVMHRPWRGDTLVAFRDRGAPDTVRRSDGSVAAGTRDDWTFLRFHDHAHRVDLTSNRPDRAHLLANHLATSMWSTPRRFVHARDPLSRDRLDDFLERLTSPDDPTFGLLEITAVVPGRWREPVIRVGNTGQERVEQVVCDLRQMFAFARSSTHVHRVKVGFTDDDSDKHYRIELHFPLPDDADDDLVLSYGDRGWTEDVASRFEALIRDELGVQVHPKAPTRSRRRPSPYPSRPSKIDAEVWRALLASHIDNPADWQLELLRAKAADGLLRLEEHAVFRCGDPQIPLFARPDLTYDCPGLVVLPFGRVSEADPFAQEAGEEYPCSVCGNRWSTDSFRYPVFHRVSVQVVAGAVWTEAQRVLVDRMGFEREADGVFTRRRDGVRQYVVGVDAAAPAWLDRRRAEFNPVAWVGGAAADLAEYADRGVPLAELLADKDRGIRRALDLGLAAPARSGAPSLAAEPPPPSWTASAASPPRPDLGLRLIQPGDDGIYVQDTRIVDATQGRVHLLFAMLQKVIDDEAAPRRGRRAFRTAARLSELDATGEIEAKDVHQWVHRARKLIDRVLPDHGKLIIEPGGRKGIRLGPGFDLEGFDLQVELSAYKASRKKG